MFLSENSLLAFESNHDDKTNGWVEIGLNGSCGVGKSDIDSIIIYGVRKSPLTVTLHDGTVINVDSEDFKARAFYNKVKQRLQINDVNYDFCRDTNKIIWNY